MHLRGAYWGVGLEHCIRDTALVPEAPRAVNARGALCGCSAIMSPRNCSAILSPWPYDQGDDYLDARRTAAADGAHQSRRKPALNLSSGPGLGPLRAALPAPSLGRRGCLTPARMGALTSPWRVSRRWQRPFLRLRGILSETTRPGPSRAHAIPLRPMARAGRSTARPHVTLCAPRPSHARGRLPAPRLHRAGAGSAGRSVSVRGRAWGSARPGERRALFPG